MARSVPPFRLVAEPLTEEAAASTGFEWADREIGTRHRIGGQPEDLPGAETPGCPGCGEEMSFYGQLDSIGDDCSLADVGVIVVFFCFDCNEALAKLASS